MSVSKNVDNDTNSNTCNNENTEHKYVCSLCQAKLNKNTETLIPKYRPDMTLNTFTVNNNKNRNFENTHNKLVPQYRSDLRFKTINNNFPCSWLTIIRKYMQNNKRRPKYYKSKIMTQTNKYILLRSILENSVECKDKYSVIKSTEKARNSEVDLIRRQLLVDLGTLKSIFIKKN